MLALAHPWILPSATCHDVGTLVAIISQLNTLPACAPVNASPPASRLATHDSGSGWFATPFLYDSFIHYSTPVYPDAILPTGDFPSPFARSVDESGNQFSACPTPSAEKANANRAEIPHDATGRRSPASLPLTPPPSGTRRVAAKPRRLDPTRSTSAEDACV